MTTRRVRRALIGTTGLALVTAAACGTAPDVAVERSDQILVPLPGTDDPVFSEGDQSTDDTAPATTAPDGEIPDPAAEPPTTVATAPVVTDPDAIDFGDEKPARERDDFLLAAFTDIELWLSEEFEPAFGIPFVPLRGEVYAGYPQRSDPIPGCGPGRETTPYDELRQFVAFYCPLGDFMAYDDGDGGLLDTLSDEFGPATIGIVLAHEYGHAIQQRIGALERRLPTVVTEQQADCVAGAWAARAAGGLAPGVPFAEADVQASLVAMIEVQDPIGTDPTSAGGHGSGFDRVGAFQTGFADGLDRCAELIDDPLPLTPLNFLSQEDVASEGNAPFGFEDDELFGFLPADLNLFFGTDLATTFPGFDDLLVIPTQQASEVPCANPVGDYGGGVVLCDDEGVVALNIPVMARLYAEFGDFAPGYLIGSIWSESALLAVGDDASGEERQLLRDCLVGAWVRSATPQLDANGNFVFDADNELVLLEPRSPDRTALLSPNDLTEAIQTAILIGDPSVSSNVLGSAFEKIDAFRAGALTGLDACG